VLFVEAAPEDAAGELGAVVATAVIIRFELGSVAPVASGLAPVGFGAQAAVTSKMAASRARRPGRCFTIVGTPRVAWRHHGRKDKRRR
jgi:hypothetical protein